MPTLEGIPTFGVGAAAVGASEERTVRRSGSRLLLDDVVQDADEEGAAAAADGVVTLLELRVGDLVAPRTPAPRCMMRIREGKRTGRHLQG